MSCSTNPDRLACPVVRGFTLIELAAALVVLGLLAMLAVALVPGLTDRMRLDRTRVDESQFNQAVVGFALAHNRLPCPDTNDNGLEGGAGGCAAPDEVGKLPYRSMGLPGAALDEARLPLRYGVYRNAGASADLVTLKDLFEPALPDRLAIKPGVSSSCNGTLPIPVTRIAYSNPPVTTLVVNNSSGTFQADDLIGFTKLGYNNMQAVTPPAPSAPNHSPFCDINCPCGVTNLNAGDPNKPAELVCTTCSGFTQGNGLTSNPSIDTPFVKAIKSDNGTVLLGFPGSGAASGSSKGFSIGDTLSELYVQPPSYLAAEFNNNECPTTRTITTIKSNPAAPPGPYTLTSTVETAYLQTGVTATVTSVEGKMAHVVSANGAGSNWKLSIDQLPTTPFAPGDTIYATPSGATGTVVSQTTVQTHFTDGETVTGSSGGSATIQSGTLTPYGFTVAGGINGTIAAKDTITGNASGTEATVVQVTGDNSAIPTATRGTIAFTPTVSGQTNELDFCQALRNAISATGSPNAVHTVNQDQAGILINPAYLLASGGVEDANGNGVDGSFDQRNEIVPSRRDFESPARLRNQSPVGARAYDDVVATMQMKVLANRLKCARNIGAVNALAVDATVERNLEELVFQQNEEALTNIDLSYRSLQLAKVDQRIKEVQLVLNTVELAMEIYKADQDFEGLASIVAVGTSITTLALAINSLVSADNAVDDAQSSYADACTSQQGTASALTGAITAATHSLDRALRADAWGGVQ